MGGQRIVLTIEREELILRLDDDGQITVMLLEYVRRYLIEAELVVKKDVFHIDEQSPDNNISH